MNRLSNRLFKTLISKTLISIAALLLSGEAVLAADMPGVTATEIKLGQTMPYSGPASAYSIVGRAEVAYFNMINDQGGVNGRKIKLISLDDAYSPPKAVEQVRKLVEEDEVLAIFSMLGTPPILATAKYLNSRGVPQLFSQTGSSLPANVKEYPLTTIYSMPFRTEAWIMGAYILKNKPNAKIGILYQNDEFGKGYLRFFKQGLGDKASLVTQEVAYDISSPTIDSQIIQLKNSGVDTVITAATPKFAAQAIRKIYELDWKPTHLLINAASSREAVLKPAGFEQAKGVLAVNFELFTDDPAYADKYKDYFAFMKKWAPNENPYELAAVNGYISAQFMVEILKKCGNDLTRENVMKYANDFPEVPHPLLFPGVTYNATATDHTPFHAGQITRFDGDKWILVGEAIRPTPPTGE